MEFSEPHILTDKSRLNEIYALRTRAYEHSYKSVYVNSEVLQEGWKDDLDDMAIHWVVEQEGRIIASARLVILDDLEQTGEDILGFDLPHQRPFAYYSRLVVDPAVRGNGIGKAMDDIRISYIRDHNVAFALAFSFVERSDSLLRLGFRELGTVSYKWCGLPLPATLQHFFIFQK
jgi:GNAT superfamily N-acetyltransferase